jgi:hypothetical protein
VTRFVVDCAVVLRLASEEIEVAAGHRLLAPTLLRSQTLSAVHEAVHRGEIPADAARDVLARVNRIRLPGDAVLRDAPGRSRRGSGEPRPRTPSTSSSHSCRPTRS